MKKILLVASILLVLVACENTQKPTATDYKEKLIYFKDDFGFCYAAIRSHNAYGSVISITFVPCHAGIK